MGKRLFFIGSWVLIIAWSVHAFDGARGDRLSFGPSGALARNYAVAKRVTKKYRVLDPGNWGGQGVRLDVTRGEVTLEFDCAHGSIEKILLDKRGSFKV